MKNKLSLKRINLKVNFIMINRNSEDHMVK